MSEEALEPLLEWDDDIVGDDLEAVASNDEWAYQQADRLIKRLPGREGRDRRTEGEVFDHSTLMVLHRMLSQGILRSLDFPISTGKEANVFRGTTPAGGLVAVKIYRVNTATFKHVLKYIQGDERFQGVTGDRRALVHAWAQKEYRNLLRIRAAGVDVPEPIKVVQNVLVTEYLGTSAGPWPKLKDLGRLERPVAQAFWEKVRDDYVAIHNQAGLVHADISEYNILVERADLLLNDEAEAEEASRHGAVARPRIIDVGQAVLLGHPMAWEFRDRDLHNIASYFRRMRVAADEAALKHRLVMPE